MQYSLDERAAHQLHYPSGRSGVTSLAPPTCPAPYQLRRRRGRGDVMRTADNADTSLVLRHRSRRVRVGAGRR